jgi:hypothetical protein
VGVAARVLGSRSEAEYVAQEVFPAFARSSSGPLSCQVRIARMVTNYDAAVSGLPITGRCLCGAVRFEIAEEPLSAGYCHCTRCQRRTGAAASAQARLATNSLRITAGADQVRTWQPEQGFAKLFCGACGSALFSHDPTKEHWAVRLGALDPGHGIRPTFRQRVESACEWEPLPDDGLERFQGRAPAND